MVNKARRDKGRAAPPDPRKVKDLFARAVNALQAGDTPGGIRFLERADALAPSNPQILFNLGYAHHAAGRFARAVEFYRRSAAVSPDNPPTWINLAAAARAAGDLRESIRALRTVLANGREDPAVMSDLGAVLAEAGELDDAVATLERALELDPDRIETRVNLADVLRSAGRMPSAESHLRAALDAEPGHARARRALVSVLDDQGRVDDAAAVLADWPGGLVDPADRIVAGNVELRRGRVSAAETYYRQALSVGPAGPALLNNLGLVRVLRGDRDDAERLFREALQADDRFTEAWRHLCALRRFDDVDDPDIDAMRRLLGRRDLSDDASTHLGFALGKALDDCGQYDEAFEHFARANELRRRQVPFDVSALSEHARRIRAVFATESRWPAGGSTSALPVYIVGMPRTGTSLLEQMLSAHPAFHGAGELLLVNRLIANLESDGQTPYPECAAGLSIDARGVLAADYLSALRVEAPGDDIVRISDKMPYNFFHLGLVRMLFPQAVILHCVRDPLDTCLSAWFNYFPRGLDFTYDFDDLAGVFGVYREMMAHWRAHPAVDFIDVPYESLVEDPAPVLGRVFDGLGLPWQDAVLDFHRQTRDVRTLSAWQVRQPLHTGSRARWRSYARHIGPLMDALAPWIDPA